MRKLIFVFLAMLLVTAAFAAEEQTPKLTYFQATDTASLLEAVSNVGPEGATIAILPGTYTIKDTITFTGSNVNLLGSGWNTLIRKVGDGDAIVFKGSCWQCSVRNMVIEGDPKMTKGSGIVFREGEWSGICVIDRCHVRIFPESGIRFEGNAKKPFSSNTVSNCWLTGNLGDQLYSLANNDFYIIGNQLGTGADRLPKSGAFLDHSSAGTYSMNYHWGNTVGFRLGPGANFNRIENNRFEQSRRQGILIGNPDGGDACQLNIITGNTIHTNSEKDKGVYPAVAAYDAVDTTFCENQVFSWDSNTARHKNALVIGRGCASWIVKDNIFRHCTEAPIVYDKKANHIVKDNIQ